MSDRLVGDAGVTVVSVAELEATQARRAAAANPMMGADFIGVPPSSQREQF